MGAVPYTCIAVYAGMVISSLEEINTMFSHTSVMWYCIYGVLGVICVISFVALIKYTAAEMKAAVAAAPRPTAAEDGECAGDEEADFGELPRDATLFGTFTSNNRVGGDAVGGDTGGEEMQTFGDGDGDGVARAPLLGEDAHRRGDAVIMGGANGGGRKTSSIVDV